MKKFTTNQPGFSLPNDLNFLRCMDGRLHLPIIFQYRDACIGQVRLAISLHYPWFFVSLWSTRHAFAMDDFLAARSQMAMSLGFHIIFACIGMVMPFFMSISHFIYLKTGNVL